MRIQVLHPRCGKPVCSAIVPQEQQPLPVSVKGCALTTKFTQVGVVSTPVIDATAGYLYLVAETYENANVVHRLHVLQVSSGQERAGSPITIRASYTHAGITVG
jgi:hypothetical protein